MENLPPAAWRMPWGDSSVSAVVDLLLRRKTERWVKHYSSSDQILLVGEGDFSFSLSLALAFGSASNILATSLDSYGQFLISLISLYLTLICVTVNQETC